MSPRFEEFPTAPPRKPRSWDATDAVVLLGAGACIAGVALISVPVAVILGGLVLIGIGMFSEQRR